MDKALTAAKIGDRVTLYYTCQDSVGEPLEEVPSDKPVTVTLGDGEMLPALEDALCGMTAGMTKKVTLPPELAFGEYEDELVDVVPRKDLETPDGKLEIGMEFEFEEDGEMYGGRIVDLNDENAYIDANHPLAGVTLTFMLTVVAVEPQHSSGKKRSK